MHKYFPHTPEEIAEMLGVCGVYELRDLYADVPPELTIKSPTGSTARKARRR